MVGEKVKFTCKSCGWQTSIRVEWADLRPKRCMNKKCNKSFHKEPDQLQIEFPKKPEVKQEIQEKAVPKKRTKKKQE